ncbi:MAG: TonB-dependent receptor [Steroidobacteraceae bacterium]|nr:TonB-dependent receptor [Steroidobacteraceae bacterium]
MSNSIRRWLSGIACSVAFAAGAQAAPTSAQIDVPAGELVVALDSLARQTGVQFVYRADQLRGVRTAGVQGADSADAALDHLLLGSGFGPRREASGAVVIVRNDRPARALARAQTDTAAGGTGGPAPQAEAPPAELEVVQVTGSRIARTAIEGPSPITVITADDIQAAGFTAVPELLRSITQNGGETQSQQSASGADFTPGAQQVDLRGLGPNHTLVLVNGRRIADFPLPFKGRSNFTDVSSIPLGMVERVEVLTGSASAVYGSDAIAGVVNFILKQKPDGTAVTLRYGEASRGGDESLKLDLSSGFERGAFTAVFGAELLHQKPLWAFDRGIQDSTLDAPTARSQIARRVFLRTNWYDEYLDPGQATCDALASLNDGSTFRAVRPGWGIDGDDGFYCGSNESIGYGTILSERKGVNAYGSLNYRFDNGHRWFADIQAGYHKLALYRDVTQWSYMAPDGNEEGYFYNQATDDVEYWQRQFSPEEMGGLGRGMIRNNQTTVSVTTGFAGNLTPDWTYELALSHSQYEATISWPQIVAAAANELFLGPQLGTDDDGFPIFDADPARLYTPLTRSEYDAIGTKTTYHPESRTDTLALTLGNAALFDLPAGPVGFAGVVEAGNQAYELNPDPLATEYYYYSWKDSDGHGSRNRWAAAGELRAPLLETLNLSVAGRYDQYHYSGHGVGKFTYNAGLEWRPVQSLLVRGSYGTGFRAADLHYVFAGPGNDETSGIDYYACLSDDPGASDCSDYDEDLIRGREGNRNLDPETSTSWTAGFVWSPSRNFDLTVDYFDIRMRDQVLDMSVDSILRDEASCRLGTLDPASPTCVDALSRVTRINGDLYGIFVNPVNVARETTSGLDVSAQYRLPTPIGEFRLSANHTWVNEHEFQQFRGDPIEDQFAVNSGFDIPRTKSSATLAWRYGGWSASLHAERLGKLPNSDSYDQVYDPEDGGSPWIDATWRYNASAGLAIGEAMQVLLMVDNLTDEMPPKDPTYTAYPYYDISWFDSVGRSYYLSFTYRFGGGPR